MSYPNSQLISIHLYTSVRSPSINTFNMSIYILRNLTSFLMPLNSNLNSLGQLFKALSAHHSLPVATYYKAINVVFSQTFASPQVDPIWNVISPAFQIDRYIIPDPSLNYSMNSSFSFQSRQTLCIQLTVTPLVLSNQTTKSLLMPGSILILFNYILLDTQQVLIN